MKATLEFNLPDDEVQFQHAVNAFEAYRLLMELDDSLRSVVKYGTASELGELDPKSAEKIRAWIANQALEFGIAHLIP